MVNKHLEFTSCAAKMTYQVEAMRLVKSKKSIIKKYIDTAKKMKLFPNELVYISSFYDEKTGSSGTFFRNDRDNNYILAYTGTNTYTDAVKDIETDIYGIALGQGYHYSSCFKFYKKMFLKYGDNIILTGHSLGGNIAQRVALEFNVKKTVIYNSAPLYIKNGVNLFMDLTEENKVLYNKRLRKYKRNVVRIDMCISQFTGEIIHFSSEEDMLNRIMSVLGDDAVYYSKNYILKGAGLHSLKLIIDKCSIIIEKVLSGERVDVNLFVSKYLPIDYTEKGAIKNLAKSKSISLDYIAAIFLGNEQAINYVAMKYSDININKFMAYLVKKIQNS